MCVTAPLPPHPCNPMSFDSGYSNWSEVIPHRPTNNRPSLLFQSTACHPIYLQHGRRAERERCGCRWPAFFLYPHSTSTPAGLAPTCWVSLHLGSAQHTSRDGSHPLGSTVAMPTSQTTDTSLSHILLSSPMSMWAINLITTSSQKTGYAKEVALIRPGGCVLFCFVLFPSPHSGSQNPESSALKCFQCVTEADSIIRVGELCVPQSLQPWRAGLWEHTREGHSWSSEHP